MKIRKKLFLKLNLCEKMLLLLVVIIFFCNIYVSKVAGIISYGTYLALLIITVYFISRRKIFVEKKWGEISFDLLILGIFSSVHGEYVIGNVLGNLHQHFFFSLFLFLSMYICWNNYIGLNFVINFMKVVVTLGLIAVIYALIVQGHFIPLILLTNNEAYYQFYKSFFSNRNVYAAYLFFSSTASLYFYSLTKHKRYIFFIALFSFQVYLASSKASLLAICIMICIYIYLKTKNKAFVLVLAVIAILPALYYILLPMLSNLGHYTNDGISSSQIRLQNWEMGIKKLIDEMAILNGLGMGSEVCFLTSFRRYGSFHNVYIDLLFQGGVIKLLIYLYALKDIWLNIKKCCDINIKIVIEASFIAIIAHGFVESGAMLFSNTYYSFLSTILFAILPQCSLNRKVDLNNEINSM